MGIGDSWGEGGEVWVGAGPCFLGMQQAKAGRKGGKKVRAGKKNNKF